MKKVFKLNNLCCANCAAKIENEIARLENVSACTLNFMTMKLSIVAEEERMDDILPKVFAIVKKIEPDVKVIEA